MFGNGEVPFYEPSNEANTRRLVLIGVLAAVLLGIVISVFLLLGGSTTSFQVNANTSSLVPEKVDDSESKDQEAASIFVHVLGCVRSPGVYALSKDARVFQAIEAAGGMTEDAFEASVNLAGTLTDGTQVKVLSQQDAANESSSQSEMSSLSSGVSASASTYGKVNINTATVSELQTLSGVGESTAKKIISFREQNGPFASIEDLMNVSGIGEKKFESLKDSITV